MSKSQRDSSSMTPLTRSHCWSMPKMVTNPLHCFAPVTPTPFPLPPSPPQHNIWSMCVPICPVFVRDPRLCKGMPPILPPILPEILQSVSHCICPSFKHISHPIIWSLSSWGGKLMARTGAACGTLLVSCDSRRAVHPYVSRILNTAQGAGISSTCQGHICSDYRQQPAAGSSLLSAQQPTTSEPRWHHTVVHAH